MSVNDWNCCQTPIWVDKRSRSGRHYESCNSFAELKHSKQVEDVGPITAGITHLQPLQSEEDVFLKKIFELLHCHYCRCSESLFNNS